MDRFDFDDEYVRRLLAGDRETVEHFYAYFNRVMLMKLRARLRTMEDIDDVRQETFTRVLNRLGTLREGGALGSFVLSTCEHVCLEHVRKNNKNRRSDHTEVAVQTATDHDQLDDVMQDEADARVRRVLGRMEPRDRDIMQALFLDELPKDDICSKFGIDREYLRVLLYRAKKKFKELFEKKSIPPFGPSLIFVTLWRLWSLRL